MQWFPIPQANEVNKNARIDPARIEVPDRIIEDLKQFIRDSLREFTGYSKKVPDGAICGLSGGIDSSVLALLTKQALEKTNMDIRGLILGRGPKPESQLMSESELEDVYYANKFAEEVGIETCYVDIEPAYSSVVDCLKSDNEWILSGVLPRLRSLFLYQYADLTNRISLGSTNGTETILVSWTVGGPAGHLEPLDGFYKSEIYHIAQKIGVPHAICHRAPLVSELNVKDEALYGGDCYILDPILRLLYDEKKSPEEVAKLLGHSANWIEKIHSIRIHGERHRRYPPYFLTEDPDKYDGSVYNWNRSYLTNIE